jgi:hypothetical protein
VTGHVTAAVAAGAERSTQEATTASTTTSLDQPMLCMKRILWSPNAEALLRAACPLAC